MLTVVAGLVILVVAIGWLSGVFETKVEPARTERSVRRIKDKPTDVVREREKSTIEEAIGTLKVSSRTVVSSKIMATIDDITVNAGDQVEKGQLLIRLDDKEYQSRLDQSRLDQAKRVF